MIGERVDLRRYRTREAATGFLNEMAQLLDERRQRDWFERLTDDVEYRVPVRVTKSEGEESEFSEDTFYFRENRHSIDARIKRFETEYAWSENPPSRTRRFVSNVRVTDERDDEIDVRDNFMLYRSRGQTTDYALLTGERFETIREVDGNLKLASREVRLDHSILPMNYLSVFL